MIIKNWFNTWKKLDHASEGGGGDQEFAGEASR